MKKLLSLTLVLMLILSLAACGNTATETAPAETTETATEAPAETTTEETTVKNKLEQIQESGKLIMGTNANYPPFEFHTMVDGQDVIAGFDIQIANEIAKDMGVELEVQDIEFSAVLAGVETGLIDVGIAGINPTPARDEVMDFSDVYFESYYTVLVKKEDIGKYTTQEALKGATIGVQTATVQEELANAVADATIVSLPKTPDLVLQLKSGMIDAIITENTVADTYAAENEDLAAEPDLEFEGASGGAAVAMKNDEPELQAQINSTLKRLMDSGDIEKFYNEAIELANSNKD